jgi:hypothetical protein
MLNRVRQVDLGSFDFGRLESSVQYLPSWPDEWLAAAVLYVARLLADEHHPRLDQSGSEHHLRS